MVLFLFVLTNGSHGSEAGVIFILLSVAIGLATVFIAAAWAVLGPGSYLKRLFWTHLFTTVVGVGYFAGLIATMPDHAWDNGSWVVLTQLKLFLFGIAPISLAAQLPFWFFRAIFGWQFTFGSSPPTKSFSLRDIFVFTFLAALSFAGPQLAANQFEVDKLV